MARDPRAPYLPGLGAFHHAKNIPSAGLSLDMPKRSILAPAPCSAGGMRGHPHSTRFGSEIGERRIDGVAGHAVIGPSGAVRVLVATKRLAVARQPVRRAALIGMGRADHREAASRPTAAKLL